MMVRPLPLPPMLADQDADRDNGEQDDADQDADQDDGDQHDQDDDDGLHHDDEAAVSDGPLF